MVGREGTRSREENSAGLVVCSQDGDADGEEKMSFVDCRSRIGVFVDGMLGDGGGGGGSSGGKRERGGGDVGGNTQESWWFGVFSLSHTGLDHFTNFKPNTTRPAFSSHHLFRVKSIDCPALPQPKQIKHAEDFP